MNMEAANLLLEKESYEIVARDKVVRLRFRVTEEGGELLQYGDDLFYLHGGYGGAFPKVERAMEGCRVGDSITLGLSPEEGYGQRDAALVMTLPSDEFGEQAPTMGEAVEGQLPDGESMVFTVTGVSPEHVVLDGNHPFAGKYLSFQFEVLEIRNSTEAERAAGFAFDGMFC